MTYAEMLKDPRWQKKRLEILERDEWACQMCHSGDKTLHVHHNYYDYSLLPWEYPEESLITLCEECHKDEYPARMNYSCRLLLETAKKSGLKPWDIGWIAYVVESLHKTVCELQRSNPGSPDYMTIIPAISWFFSQESNLVHVLKEFDKEKDSRRA